jgi:hypothetical protein
MKPKDLAMAAVLLVAGTVLQYSLVMLNLPLVPDLITAFCCLAIIRFNLTIRESVGTGIAAGILSMLVPGSIFPTGNLISGPAAAFTCYYFHELYRDRGSIAPLVPTFLATLISGLTFIATVMLFSSEKLIARFGVVNDSVVAYIPVVIGTAVLNTVIVWAIIRVGRATAQGTKYH